MDQQGQTMLDFLLQHDITGGLLPAIGKEQWQVLYLTKHDSPHRLGMWCALLDEGSAARALERDGWDLLIGDSRPGFSQSWSDGEEITAYHRFGGNEGVRPLVRYRSFYGAFPKYVELDEEFRLYHDLAEDKDRGLLLAFDASGREIEVVQIKPGEVRAKLAYLRQFQAGTGLHLAIYVDSVRYSGIPIDEIPLDQQRMGAVGPTTRWTRTVSKCEFREDHETFSRLLCKAVLPPPPREQAGIWPFDVDVEAKTVAFIAGFDQEGRPVEYTSAPDDLDNYFGANPGAPHYLTPVFFRREVLAKYFAEPERYTVADGRLTCLSLWSCQIDNDLPSHVVVFLGDLGRDLPYEERLHWRQFNVPPEGRVSETNFRRSFLAQFTEPQAADLVFRHEYAAFCQTWEKAQGWPLFLASSAGDSHLLDTVRVPVTNSQAELDEQVGHLTKLLVDSLNEKELETRAAQLPENAKGISKFDGFLRTAAFAERESVVQYLRDLQTLRSTGSAHRKGSGYDKIIAKLGISPARKPEAIRRLLEEATAVLRALRLHFCGDNEAG